MDIAAQSSFLRILWFNSETGLLTRVNTTHKHSMGRRGLKRDTNRSLQWLEREIPQPRLQGSGRLSQRAWSCRGQHCTPGGGSGQRPVTGPAYSQPLEGNGLTPGSLFWITGLQELPYFCLKKVNVRLSEGS